MSEVPLELAEFRQENARDHEALGRKLDIMAELYGKRDLRITFLAKAHQGAL